MWVFHVWIIHIWIIHIWIFHIWIFPVWRNRLWLFVNLKDRVAHPALGVALPVTDKVAVIFKLPESCQNSIGAFLADRRKTFR